MKVKIEIEIEDAQIHELVRELIYTIEDVADAIDTRKESETTGNASS
jgi:hypothetical protein|tara:strand:- start:3004 stop:3144 length:141 start_codon:yes stop_codon:yes gene_type:complete